MLLKKVHVRKSCPAGALTMLGLGWAGQPMGASLKAGEFVLREVRRSDLGKRFLLKTPVKTDSSNCRALRCLASPCAARAGGRYGRFLPSFTKSIW